MSDRGRAGRGRGHGKFDSPSSRGRGDAGRGRGDGGRGRGDGGRGRGDAGRGRGDRGRGQGEFRGGYVARGNEGQFRGGRGGFRRGQSGPVTPFRQNGNVNVLNLGVETTEDDTFVTTVESQLQSLSIKDEPFRPAYATEGRPITLWTNYFELLPDRKQSYIRYNISVTLDGNGDGNGEALKGKKLEHLVRLLLLQLPTTIPVASDYGSTILAAKSLGFDKCDYQIEYESEDKDKAPAKRPGAKYTVRLLQTGTVEFGDLLDYLSSTNLNQGRPVSLEETVQAMNIIVGHGMKSSENVISRRNTYAPYSGPNTLIEKSQLRDGLEAFRGFFMSVRLATARVLLNVQVQNIVVWETLPLQALYHNLYSTENIPLSTISRMISGLWIQAGHMNGRLKRIAGLASPTDGRRATHASRVPVEGANALETQFWKDDPKKPQYITVAAYFERTYKKLLSPNLPVVNVGTKQAPIYLPMEHCTVRRMQEYSKKLSPNATASMIRFAVKGAPLNAQRIAGAGVGVLQHYSGTTLNDFGLHLNPAMLTVSGRILPGKNVNYAGKRVNTRDASWNMRDIKFSKGATLPTWSYLWITIGGNGGSFQTMAQVREAVDRFRDKMVLSGITAQLPIPGQQLQIKNLQEAGPEIEKLMGGITNVNLLLVVLPFNSTPLYNAIKRAGDVKFGIHTINVVADNRKFAKMEDNSQYFANVALKFNLKLGGQNQLLQASDLGFVAEGKTMIVGLDVTHPDPGSALTAPSVSSITASTDANLMQWPADVAIQKRRQEMVENLKEMFKSRLRLWQKHNRNQLPEEIIVYRDGVSEGQYKLVLEVELPQIRAACTECYPPTSTEKGIPYLTIIICGKRIKTRFYPTDPAEQDDRTGGTKSGTVVDRGVTQTRIWDFYLQAHTALQGTPKPTHYVIVHDEIFRRRAASSAGNKRDNKSVGQRAADSVESLTHSMCYLYGRATKAVSLCPPAYYADLACDRARRWLSNVFDDQQTITSSEGPEARQEDVRVHERLKDTMFYI